MTAQICSARWPIRAGSSVPSGPVRTLVPTLTTQVCADSTTSSRTRSRRSRPGRTPARSPGELGRSHPAGVGRRQIICEIYNLRPARIRTAGSRSAGGLRPTCRPRTGASGRRGPIVKIVGMPSRHYNNYSWPAQGNSALTPGRSPLHLISRAAPGSGSTGWAQHMGELFHECGVAAVYHAAGRPVSACAPTPGESIASPDWSPGCCSTCRTADSSPRGWQLSPRPQRPPQDAQGSRHGRRGLPAEPSRRVRGDHAGGGRPGGDRPRPIRHLRAATTAATPSRSSATMGARPSGSPSPSTASSPITTSSRRSCSPRATTT